MKKSKKTTIGLDGKTEKELRKLQSRVIKATKKNYSLSKIINLVLLNGLKL